MEQDIRLAYSALTNQVRVSFNVELVHEDDRPSKSLMRRAKSKLEDEQGKGVIEGFVVYEKALEKFWDYLRALEGPARSRSASFVLAQGYRPLRDAELHYAASQKLWLLTLPDAPEGLQKMGWYRFQAWVLSQMEIDAHEQPLLRSCILEAYFRALLGEKLREFSLRAPSVDVNGSGNRMIHDKEGQRMLLCMNDGSPLVELEGIKDLSQKVLAHLARLQEKSPLYVGFKKELQDFLKDHQGGAESFGFGLPMIIPIAYRPPQEAAQKKSAEKASPQPEVKAPAEKKSGGKGLISIEILKDGMEARIKAANEQKLRSGSYDSDRGWIEKALADAGITFGYDSFVDALLNRLTLGEALKGQVIAAGIPPQAGDRPYLFPCYLYRNAEATEDEFDIRSNQNKLVVDVGDLICEMRYYDGISGTDVFGNKRQEIKTSWLERFEIGPGVELRSDHRFYSLIRGIPKLDKPYYIACREVYVHDGDVNLKSGNIYFDGDVEVRGSVDNGARVFAKGHLMVRGSIGQAKVRSGGDIRVEQGIITTQEGLVIAAGKVQAQFIENSRVVAGKDIGVALSILSSHVKAGGKIGVRAGPKGVLGGGSFTAQGGIKTQKFGFLDGEKTYVRIGSDWQMEFRLDILQRRAARLRKYQQLRLQEIEELKRRPGQAERCAQLEKRALRARKLADKIERSHEALKGKLRWNEDALLIVEGELVNNVDLTINGRSVPLPAISKEVMISGIRYRDQFVNSLIYLEQFRRARAKEAS